MASILVRAIGINPDEPIDVDTAVLIVRRRSDLPPQLALLVVIDYKGDNNDEAAKHLKVLPDTLKSYWRRVYTRLNYKQCKNPRAEVRAWVENLLHAELEGEGQAKAS
jgi:DNA-binding NarL/FixJ family response regulator